ncbi:hypothetical protein NPJ88_000105 [Halomonas elongata]|uniref:hypothetical protein n=1 Tax=Halomonas elongata TaxID=2746 RepID=UPI00255AADDE|nr:hypothetical protein [Halomonas elongata]MDL4860724.1 hypothetical protein [Halomonas elongata]
MTSTYAQRFQAALDRTERFGLATPAVHPVTQRYLTEQATPALYEVLKEQMAGLGPEHLVARCIPIHRGLRPHVTSVLGCEALLTLGHVETPEQTRFERSEAAYQANLDGTYLGDLNRLHAWLTLPSMEILDLTFVTSMAAVNGWGSQYEGLPILSHADELKDGLAYHPMLVGPAFLAEVAVRHGVAML